MTQFTPSTTDKRRVIIVDFSHMAYSYTYGGPALCKTLKIGSELVSIDTTIPAMAIKRFHDWSRQGANPIAICFDSAGNAKSRKAYFRSLEQKEVLPQTTQVSYKSSRDSFNSTLYEGMDLTASYLSKGGVVCYKLANYEADDIIKLAVDQAKIMYPDLPIDVITGDQDLIPLVDDQVSVFYRNPKRTYAVSKDIEKLHYIQITPENYSGVVEDLSEFKTSKLNSPYNTLLLKKLLRGKKGDDLPGKSDWKPRVYNRLLELLQRDNVDIGKLFRYGTCSSKIYRTDTGEEVPKSEISRHPMNLLTEKYQDPVELDNICEVLSTYVGEDDIEHIRRTYRGINLNGAFTGLGSDNRRPAKLTTPITGYDSVQLGRVVMELDIRLKY